MLEIQFESQFLPEICQETYKLFKRAASLGIQLAGWKQTDFQGGLAGFLIFICHL